MGIFSGGMRFGNTRKYPSLLSGRQVGWARIEFKTTWDPEASLKNMIFLNPGQIVGTRLNSGLLLITE